MNDLKTRIAALLQVFENWLTPDNHYVQQAIDQTIEEGYFGFEDVTFAVESLERCLTKNSLEKWVKLSGLADENDARGKNILCLHAGNLPLVGFQNVLAVLLCGARYTGKISRKDPYLLPTFLNEAKKTDVWGATDIQWSHNLADFEGMRNHSVLFAGSQQSVAGVKKALRKYNLLQPGTRLLIRSAHFSMAYFDDKSPQHLQALAEAILRYGGKGCKSVAIVVSPFKFEDLRKVIKDAFAAFMQNNPQHEKPAPKLKHRFAYNKAIQRPQIWLDDFLLQENGLELDQDFICYWVQGNPQTAADLAAKYAGELQSMYVTGTHTKIPGCHERTEWLSNAQKPPIYWKPDGKDTLQWLIGE